MYRSESGAQDPPSVTATIESIDSKAFVTVEPARPVHPGYGIGKGR